MLNMILLSRRSLSLHGVTYKRKLELLNEFAGWSVASSEVLQLFVGR